MKSISEEHFCVAFYYFCVVFLRDLVDHSILGLETKHVSFLGLFNNKAILHFSVFPFFVEFTDCIVFRGLHHHVIIEILIFRGDTKFISFDRSCFSGTFMDPVSYFGKLINPRSLDGSNSLCGYSSDSFGTLQDSSKPSDSRSTQAYHRFRKF